MNRTKEMLRLLDRLAVDHLGWLMRVHCRLLFGSAPEPPPNAAGQVPADPMLGPLVRMKAAMEERAARLGGCREADPQAYGEFMASVDAYSREIRRLEALLRRQLLETDPLTGVHNRQGMIRDIRREWTRALRTGVPVCVAIADLDFFKQVNDTYGHAAGDKVLCIAARFFVRRLRPYDLVFRYGGEEFLFCLPNTDSETARRVLDRLRTLMARAPVALDGGNRVGVSCSIGVAQMVPGRTVHEAVAAADRALYKAKETGRNRVVVATQPADQLPAGRMAERPPPVRGVVRH